MSIVQTDAITRLEKEIEELELKRQNLTETGRARKNKKKTINKKIQKKRQQLKVFQDPSGSELTQSALHQTSFHGAGAGASEVVYETIAGHFDAVKSVCIMPDGTIASGCADFSVKLWKNSGEEHTCMGMLDHDDEVSCVAPWGDRLVSGSYDHTIKVWNIETLDCELTIDVGDMILCMLVYGDSAIVGLQNSSLVQINLRTEEATVFPPQHEDAVTCLSMFNMVLVSGSLDGKARVWNADSKEVLFTMDFHGAVQTLSMASEDQVFIAQEGSLLLCNLDDSQGVVCQKGSKILASCISGSQFFAGSASGLIETFDLESRSKVGDINVRAKVISLSISSGTLVAGCQNGNLVVAKLS